MKSLNNDVIKSCIIIADVAQSHDGSLGCAHAFIDAVSRTGVDAIKFQTHIADAESTTAEPWRVRFSLQDKTRYDYWKRMEFTEDQWRGLRKHAVEVGLQFYSTPFSMEAFNLLKRIGVAAWKGRPGAGLHCQQRRQPGRTGRSSAAGKWDRLGIHRYRR